MFLREKTLVAPRRSREGEVAQPLTIGYTVGKPAAGGPAYAPHMLVGKKVLLIPLLLMLAGCTLGCADLAPHEALIEYERNGGFAGLDDRLVIDENGVAVLSRDSKRYGFTLEDERLNRLVNRFEEAGFRGLDREYLPSQQGADRLEYIVTYEGQTVRAMDGAVPESLQPILEALNRIVEEHGG